MPRHSTHIRTSENRYFLKLLEISQYAELCRVLVYYGTPSDARHPFLSHPKQRPILKVRKRNMTGLGRVRENQANFNWSH